LQLLRYISRVAEEDELQIWVWVMGRGRLLSFVWLAEANRRCNETDLTFFPKHDSQR